jgi:ubiquitin-protein ligase
MTGGFSLRPDTPSDGLRIFEKESFLSARLRKDRVHARVGITEAEFNAEMVVFENSSSIENTSLAHVSDQSGNLQTGAYALSQDDKAEFKQQGRGRRVLDEIRQIILNPIPGVLVHLLEHDIFEWKVFFEGPDGTPYGDHIWPLTVIFGDGYPAEPPLLRFSRIPYHMNVSEDGIVCIDIVATRYTRKVSVRQLLSAVRVMFLRPQKHWAVQIEKLMDYRHCPDEYKRKAEESGRGMSNDMGEVTFGVNIRRDPSVSDPPGRKPDSIDDLGPEDYGSDISQPERLFRDRGAALLVPEGDDEVI